MELTGKSLIGSSRGDHRGDTFRGFNPTTGEQLEPAYYSVSLAELNEAARLAEQAFSAYRLLSGRQKAHFLRKIAENIEALGDAIINRATRETGLPEPRIKTETGRTCSQLRLFADYVEEGSWVDARIDRPDPARKPLPKPDVRSLLRPLGPVAVFGASNFPLAFSVAGGDTASALAAGCPVIVKAHPAHAGTSELVGIAVRDAVRECDLPEGVFSLLYSAGTEAGTALVCHPAIRAVGFTGSRAGGRALMNAAAARLEPIPFYAEMSSVNPVFLLPGALRTDPDQLAAGLHASVTLGAGQFCTNPGLVILPDGSSASAFTRKFAELMSKSDSFTMLTPGISSSYQAGVSSREKHPRLKPLVEHAVQQQPIACRSDSALFQTDAHSFLADPDLGAEVFGPCTTLVTYTDHAELIDVARTMEGQLTATIHGTEEDLKQESDLIRILETKAGRVLFNGYPTGVEVCHAMVHGGPYPATSDGRSTSVGTRAITRFARLVCYQNFPDAAVPDELKEGNPLGILRMIDGGITRGTREPVL